MSSFGRCVNVFHLSFKHFSKYYVAMGYGLSCSFASWLAVPCLVLILLLQIEKSDTLSSGTVTQCYAPLHSSTFVYICAQLVVRC